MPYRSAAEAAVKVAALYAGATQVAARLDRSGLPRAAAPIRMAVEALQESLVRLNGVAFPGEFDDPEQDPLVLGVDPRVRSDRRLD